MTTLFGNHAAATISATEASAAPKKHGWLPVLTVLFLISYGLMTMLIVEQGQTIESQRTLIRDLFRDSSELTALKMRAQQGAPRARTQAATPSNQIPSTQIPVTQAPLTQIPSTQAPNREAPSSQAGPQGRTPNAAATQKRPLRMPSKPQPDLVDDVRTISLI